MKALNREQIAQWLSEAISQELKIDLRTVDVNREITDYGLDSLASTTIVANLEDLVGVELPATLVWDYPTVAAAAAFIEEYVANSERAHGSQGRE